MKKILINLVVLLMFSTSAFSKDVTEIIGFQLEFNSFNFINNLVENFNILNIYDKDNPDLLGREFYESEYLPASWLMLVYENEISALLNEKILPNGATVEDMMPISVDKLVYELEYKDLSNAPPYEEIQLTLMCYDGFVNPNQVDISNPKKLKNFGNGKGCEFPFINRIYIKVIPGRGLYERDCKNDFNFYRDYFLNTYDLKSDNDFTGDSAYNRSELYGDYIANPYYSDTLYPSSFYPNYNRQKGLLNIKLSCAIPKYDADFGGVRIDVSVTQSFEYLNSTIKTLHKEIIEAANNKLKSLKENETGGL